MVQDDLCRQLRLVADLWDYGVVSKDDTPSGYANVVFDFTQVTSHSLATPDPPNSDDAGRSVIVSGDVILVFRQMGEKHISSCKRCSGVLCAPLSVNGTRGPMTPRRHHAASTSQPWSKSSSEVSRGVDWSLRHAKYKEGGGIFAMFPFHTGFMGNGGRDSDFRYIKKHELDILPGFNDLLPDILEIHLLLEPLSNDLIATTTTGKQSLPQLVANASLSNNFDESVNHLEGSVQEVLPRLSTSPLPFSVPSPSFVTPPPQPEVKHSPHFERSKSLRGTMSGILNFMKSTFVSSETSGWRKSLERPGSCSFDTSKRPEAEAECMGGLDSDRNAGTSNHSRQKKTSDTGELVSRRSMKSHDRGNQERRSQKQRLMNRQLRKKRHSHQSSFRLDSWRWKWEVVYRPTSNVEEFLRRHCVVVNEVRSLIIIIIWTVLFMYGYLNRRRMLLDLSIMALLFSSLFFLGIVETSSVGWIQFNQLLRRY